MPASCPNSRPLRKCGVILTCLDNGRKRFRAVRVDPVEPEDIVRVDSNDVAQVEPAVIAPKITLK